MPSLITHYLCGDKWLKNINNEAIAALVTKYRTAFNVGTQGPDILFYYRIWPWCSSGGLDKLGTRMHGEKVGEVFQELIQYIHTRGEDKALLTAYLLGYSSHYALDSISHPYIYYKTGFSREPSVKQRFSCHHSRFEKAIDIHMLQLEQRLKHTSVKVHGLISLQSREALAIGAMYSDVISKVFRLSIRPQQIATAIKDMSKVYSLLTDRAGSKMKLFNWLEGRLISHSFVSSNIYPHKINDDYDYLNHSKSPWYLPWDNTEMRSESFYELYNRAIEETRTLCNSIYNCLQGQNPLENTLQTIGNKSFSTGEDCSSGIEMKYHNCIYEQNQQPL